MSRMPDPIRDHKTDLENSLNQILDWCKAPRVNGLLDVHTFALNAKEAFVWLENNTVVKPA